MAEAAEDENGEREDVPALMDGPAVPEVPRGDGGEAGELSTVELGERGGGRTAGEILEEQPEAPVGEDVEGQDGGGAGALWKDGLVWTVRSPVAEVDATQRLALEERTEAPGTAWDDGALSAGQSGAEGETAGLALGGARQAMPGLEGLYRQTVQAARPAAPALPLEQAGRQIPAQEPGSAAALAVDELDRAVRRDSRRYDGGMTIF